MFRYQVFLLAITPVLQVKERGVPEVNRWTVFFVGFMGLARTCGLPSFSALLERSSLLGKRSKLILLNAYCFYTNIK